MHISPYILDQIVELAKKHQLIAIGEIHGAKENPEVVFEIYNALKEKYEVVLGFEYPQTVIDNPNSADKELYEDGRFSQFHKKLLNKLKTDEAKIFGFDLEDDERKQINDHDISWRDSVMAEKISKRLATLKKDEKMIIVCGDAHFQTQSMSVKSTKPDGKIVVEKFLPMGSQISTDSILAIHLRYLSGQIYNHGLKIITPITLTKAYSFRDTDDLLEVDIQEASSSR